MPPPEPAPLGDGWSSDSTEELIEMPQIEEIVDNESLQEALRRKRLEYVRRCRSDVAFLEELDDCVQDRLDDFGDERGHGIEAEVSFSSRLLDVFRAPRIKFVRNGTDLKLEAKSILREEVVPALCAADAACVQLAREVERRVAVAVLGVRVRSINIQELPGDLEVAGFAGVHERRRPVAPSRIDVRAEVLDQ